MHTNINTVALIVTGIIFLALVPPIGVLLLIAALASQKHVNRRVARSRALARHDEREERELILAYKSLG